MDKTLESQFQRVEKALATLIASISTYNPNPSLAQDLVNADEELSHGLADLAIHQVNHARIQSLQSTSSALDAQIKSTLQLLASTRAELISTPATVFPTTTNAISYAELLSYARRISKFTLPPTYREAPLPSPAPASAAPTNGTTTPIAPAGAGTPDRTALPPPIAEWLNPHAGAADFVPWPTEETIRRGALASIQVLVEQGVDPEGFDPERSAEEERERRKVEEEMERRRVEEEEKERVRREERMREEVKRREGAGAMGRVEEKQKVFKLDLLDEEDED